MYPIVLLGDVQKAFFQIEINPCDRDALRFLWYENPKDLNPVVKEYRFTRNIFGSGPSPYILGGTMKHHLAKYQEENPSLVKHIKESLYVDDYTGGGNDTSEVFRKQHQIVKIMKDGGFTLHKWKSNDEDLLRLMSQHDAIGVESKILGIHWLPKADVMKMPFALEMSKDHVTKLIVLSTLASI